MASPIDKSELPSPHITPNDQAVDKLRHLHPHIRDLAKKTCKLINEYMYLDNNLRINACQYEDGNNRKFSKTDALKELENYEKEIITNIKHIDQESNKDGKKTSDFILKQEFDKIKNFLDRIDPYSNREVFESLGIKPPTETFDKTLDDLSKRTADTIKDLEEWKKNKNELIRLEKETLPDIETTLKGMKGSKKNDENSDKRSEDPKTGKPSNLDDLLKDAENWLKELKEKSL